MTGIGADLHLHSTASDGKLTPARLVQRAAIAGIRSMAITDHDTLSGVAPGMAAAKDLSIDLVAGVEITASGGLHILAYDFCLDHPRIMALIGDIAFARRRRVAEMYRLLSEKGINLKAASASRGGSVGRRDVARALVELGLAASENDAISGFLAPGKIAYTPLDAPPPAVVLEAIKNSGGVAILAHPRMSGITDAGIAQLAANGLDGIEVYHPAHSAHDVDGLLSVAANHDLFSTGGSDSHGTEVEAPTAHLCPHETVLKLRNLARERRREIQGWS